MVQLARSLFSLCLIAVSFASPVKRTVAQVEADIASISTQVNTLNAAINGFPASGLVGALGINTDSTNLETTLNTGTTDVKNTGPVDLADGTTILNDVAAIEPNIITALKDIASKASDFASLPIGGIPALVLSDLKTLKTDTDAFSGALIANAPAALVPEASSIQAAIDAAFTTAIAAFS
ncbi:hydrophobic surface binding protein [Mycena galopus ATCC 62051]|nr:hydrophobic surface binding protein [Mycena galopus ATCC 62051]